MENETLDVQTKKPPHSLKRPRKALSPYGMALLMACAIFVCEAGVMFLLNVLPPLSHEFEAIIDSTILLTFLTPFYFLLYRPFWEEHKRFEREIQYLSQELLSSAEEERKRVSHDLHDQCGQTLTAIQFEMDALRKSLPEQCGPQKEQVRDAIQLISQLGNELREVTHQLRPSMLDEIGLVAALRSLVSEFSEQYPAIDIRERYAHDDLNDKLPPDVEVALYRTCQESLNNVIKHAQSSEISIILERRGSKIVLSVRDNGVGFKIRKSEFEAKNLRGVGLLGMRERVAALNGDFEIFSEPGTGSTVIIALPV